MPVRESALPRNAAGDGVIPAGSVMYPGIYCKGVTIDGEEITLMPGVYHVWGNLTFTNFADVSGEGVTFILKGLDTLSLFSRSSSQGTRKSG